MILEVCLHSRAIGVTLQHKRNEDTVLEPHLLGCLDQTSFKNTLYLRQALTAFVQWLPLEEYYFRMFVVL